MQKILCIIGACFLGASIYWKTTESLPIIDDLLLKNVEALADVERDELPIVCRASGDLTCPNNGEKYGMIYQGYGLAPDEETY